MDLTPPTPPTPLTTNDLDGRYVDPIWFDESHWQRKEDPGGEILLKISENALCTDN